MTANERKSRVAPETDPEWLPADVYSRDGTLYMEFAHFPSRTLRHISYDYDLARQSRRISVPVDQLNPRCKTASQSPAGMIFHLSHSGSTLVAEMFRSVRNCQVIVEPIVVSKLLMLYDGCKQRLCQLLKFVAERMQHAFCQPGDRLLFKWSSWNAVVMEQLCSAFPSVPACFIYREPEEILVTMSERSPPWISNGLMRDVLLEPLKYYPKVPPENRFWRFLQTIGDHSQNNDTEFIAQVLGGICDAAAKVNTALLMVDYRALPTAMPDVIAPRFGMPLAGADRRVALYVSTWDVKNRDGLRSRFTEDKQRKQQRVTDEIRQACNIFIRPKLDRALSRHRGNISTLAGREEQRV